MRKTGDISGIDPLDLRRAFGRFGTGVTVITTLSKQGTKIGITANSFNTVSLDPPIVLWSLSNKSPNMDAFSNSGRFVINVLTVDQLNLSNQFSKPSEDKFAGVEYSPGIDGMPVLAGCAATIECAVVNQHVVGDHVLFLGQVEHYAHKHADPLLFFNGKYMQGVDLITAKNA
jgi:flavin reductase (DIM6/NTAB) family NADH-FMN oxidoreductase RutF